MRRLLRSPHLYIALALIAANALAWGAALRPTGPLYQAQPVLESDLADLRQRLIEGGHSGETFTLHITDQEGAETIAWFLDRHPEVPFRYPRIAFHPGEIEAWGVATVLGLRLSIHGRATMHLADGVPIVRLTELGVAGAPVPGFVLQAIQDAVYQQVDLTNRPLPVVFTSLEIREGEMVAEGVIR